MALARGNVGIDVYCGQHWATKDEVTRALWHVATELVKDHQQMARMLEEKEQALDKADSQRGDVLCTNEALVQRIGRLQSESRCLHQEVAELDGVEEE